jgi:hypothetical protein
MNYERNNETEYITGKETEYGELGVAVGFTIILIALILTAVFAR